MYRRYANYVTDDIIRACQMCQLPREKSSQFLEYQVFFTSWCISCSEKSDTFVFPYIFHSFWTNFMKLSANICKWVCQLIVIWFWLGMLKPFIFRNRFAETGFLPVTERPIVSGIIVTGRSGSALAISRSLVASRRPWPAFQMHGRRRRETKDSGISKR